jgi:phosphoribosyl 1,2-cyclic phosphodiesterase
MRLTICGARGSTPAPGAEFVRYGGHTSCIALAHDGERPRLVLDGGTGLARFSKLLGGEAFQGTILLGHLHWDHTHGLPFFPAGDRPDARVRVLMPVDGDPEEVLARAISPPHFPITPRELEGRWTFEAIDPGEHEIEGFSVLALEVPHKGGKTFGYRISDGESAVAYLSDHAPQALGPGPSGLGEFHAAARDLAAGVNLLVHDGQYTADEFARVSAFGHSAIEYAIGLARECGVPRLLVFHHDPERTDAQIDAILEAHRDAGLVVEAASEGSVIDLSRVSA